MSILGARSTFPPLPAEDVAHVFTHTSVLLQELRGQRVFLTGGTGFIGVWLLETFAHANDKLELDVRLTVLSRNPTAFCDKFPHLGRRADINFLAGDIRDFRFPEGEYPFVIHAASDVGVPGDEDSQTEVFDTIVAGTQHLLKFTRLAGVKKLLLISSGAVYGVQPADLSHVPETYSGAPDPLKASSAYGEAKRVAEFLTELEARRTGFEAKIARCFAFVGPHLPLNGRFAVGNFVRDGIGGGPIKVLGNGLAQRSYLYAADLAIWLWTIFFRGRTGSAYNVGSSESLSIAQLAQEVAAGCGEDIGIEIAQASTAFSRYVPSIDRAEQELGLRPQIDFHEAIVRTIRWHRNMINESV